MGSDQHFRTDFADITAGRGNVDLTPFIGTKGEGSPRVAVGFAPEPWLNRAVAFRSHQVRPARPRRGTITTVTTKSATWGSYRFGKIKPGRSLQGTGPF